MDLKEEIIKLENKEYDKNILIIKGRVPILFSVPHSIIQVLKNNTIKLSEPFTKAIALYLNEYCGTSAIIKMKDTNIDSNKDNKDEYKNELLRFIKKNNIKLVIDLHGANINRDFDIEFGTLNNLTSDYSIIRELEDAFIEHGIKNIKYNNPFKGGSITQNVYSLKDVDVIQIEINAKFRDVNNIDNLEKIINSFSTFIKQYIEYSNRE